ncbi:MAG: hypothetical protein K2H40_08305 [Lachnospiraceae bacterium]|nr:hypothetical protein [Lachnospiraceae bacterium]
MNFEQMRLAYRAFDEVMPIGRTVEWEGKAYHIVGLARIEKQTEMYVLENMPEKAETSEKTLTGCGLAECDSGECNPKEASGDMHWKERHTNRMSMKIVPVECPFFNIASIRFGEWELETGSADAGPLALNEGCAVDADSENFFLFYEMMKAGWALPENSPFLTMEWNALWLTRLTFRTETESLPVWTENQEIMIKWGRRTKSHYVEKPVSLTVGEEMKLDFAIEDGRQGVCYINRVYPIDIWKENEERFNNPRYLEIMSAKELEKQKEAFFRNLEQDCPRGMCYLGIEYECTLAGSLAFYDRAFLESEPRTCQGSSGIMMMHLRPDEPVGKHGLPQRGCVIQAPVGPNVRQLEAELFRFDEMFDEGKEFVPLRTIWRENERENKTRFR